MPSDDPLGASQTAQVLLPGFLPDQPKQGMTGRQGPEVGWLKAQLSATIWDARD